MHRPHPDHPSRAVGLIAFLCGIAMLGTVFVVAYHLFSAPVAGLNLSLPPHGTPPPASNIGLSLASFMEKLMLLALLTIVGSVVAGRGVHLCFAAGQATASQEEALAPGRQNDVSPFSMVTTSEKNISSEKAG